MLRCRSAAGFTFIELLVSLAIIATLASVVFPLAQLQKQREQERELRSALRDIRSALNAYKRAVDEGRVVIKPGESGYPRTLQDLVDGVEDAKDPMRRKIYFLRRIPRDPFAADHSVPAHSSWGKRSYASPADKPLEGNDVFDVYSRSPGVGLNGIPYKEW
ncbi:MAG: type II secretion system protein [Betaproteobacteria bacterium]|jgi:general secretion pathway protein G